MIKYDTPYTLLNDRFEHTAGITVYRCAGHDYGCSSEDSLATGEPHVSMSATEDGSYPFFTVPVRDLKEIQ